MSENAYHIPALMAETISGLNIRPGGTYVDVTFGGGGHSRAILSHLGAEGRLLGFDQDMDAWANRLNDNRFTFVHGNFAYLKNFLRYYGVEKVDGIVADLGVSFHHFDAEDRGFSFRFDDAPLDMRMNRNATVDAAKVLNEYDREALANVFYLYGELRQARRIADAVVKEAASEIVVIPDRGWVNDVFVVELVNEIFDDLLKFLVLKRIHIGIELLLKLFPWDWSLWDELRHIDVRHGYLSAGNDLELKRAFVLKDLTFNSDDVAFFEDL